jgi:hypothetical protein
VICKTSCLYRCSRSQASVGLYLTNQWSIQDYRNFVPRAWLCSRAVLCVCYGLGQSCDGVDREVVQSMSPEAGEMKQAPAGRWDMMTTVYLAATLSVCTLEKFPSLCNKNEDSSHSPFVALFDELWRTQSRTVKKFLKADLRSWKTVEFVPQVQFPCRMFMYIFGAFSITGNNVNEGFYLLGYNAV